MNKKEANDFQKYFKIGSWIFTGIFVIFMFSNVVKSGDLEKIIKSSESDASREKYFEQKYGNMINDIEE